MEVTQLQIEETSLAIPTQLHSIHNNH
jgi:hypothetical protein